MTALEKINLNEQFNDGSGQTANLNEQFVMQDDPNTRVLLRFVVLRPPTRLSDILPFIFVFGAYCLIIHTILAFIKKYNKSIHSMIQFLFIIIFPPIVMMLMSDYIFMVVWLALLGFSGYCLRIAFSRNLLRSKNPKKIYKMFKFIFTYTNIFIILGQLLSVGSFLVQQEYFKSCLRMLLYSLYFAVFCREVMNNLSIIMGKTTGIISSTPMGDVHDDKTKCAICMVSLIRGTDVISSENNFDNEKVFTNNCGHSFHVECIKGWTLIGGNYYCIGCKAGIEMDFMKPDLWSKTEIMVKPLMNVLRSSIAFFVVSYFYIIFRLKE